jgi:hypothetical protein
MFVTYCIAMIPLINKTTNVYTCSTSKILNLIICSMLLAIPVHAKCGGGGKKCGGGGGGGKARVSNTGPSSATLKRRAEREVEQNTISSYLNKIDEDKNGSVSMKEFTSGSGGGDEAKFKDADKNRDRSLTKTEIAKMLGLK